MPRFTSHEELKGHLVNMSDTELNRMRDFGCGKPHWSPYYVDPAYTFESRAIDGDKVSEQFSTRRQSSSGGRGTGGRSTEGGSTRGSSAGAKCRNSLIPLSAIHL